MASCKPFCLMARMIKIRSFRYETGNSMFAPEALTLLIRGLASLTPAEYGSNNTISTPSPAACSRRPLDVAVPNAVFSNTTATFGAAFTNFDICSWARANWEARAKGVNVKWRPLLS